MVSSSRIGGVLLSIFWNDDSAHVLLDPKRCVLVLPHTKLAASLTLFLEGSIDNGLPVSDVL